MMIRSIVTACIIFMSFFAISSDVEKQGSLAVHLCIDKIRLISGKPFPQEIDHAYIEKFRNGDIVAFTQGAVGTFGKRSSNYSSWWTCSVQNNEVVTLVEKMNMPIVIKKETKEIENYNDEVMEFLYKREGGEFSFCCKQKFDPKNIKKHNPEYYLKKEDTVS